jgi:hypothetical protein
MNLMDLADRMLMDHKGPDGQEEREAERLADERAADRRHEAAEARADEQDDRMEKRSADAREELRDLMIGICRPSCTLIGHDWHPNGYCRFCAVLEEVD